MAPLMLPFVAGLNVTPKVHFFCFARLPVQGAVPLPAAEKSPLVEKVKFRVWPPLFFKVRFRGPLEVPTVVGPKERGSGFNETMLAPVPESPAVMGRTAPPSMIVTAPGMLPKIFGTKLTLIVHCAPGTITLPEQLSDSL